MLLLVLAIARKPDGFFNPQFWAEDAVLFHAEAEEVGSASLIRPALGYFHTIQRVVAWLTTRMIDALYQPAAYNYAAMLASLLVLSPMATKRWTGPPAWALGAMTILATQAGEIIFNLTNVQWLTSLFIVICAVMQPPVSRAGLLLESGALLLVGLTGPFVVALLPLGFLRWWQYGKRALPGVIALAVAAAIQGWAIWRAGGGESARPELMQHSWTEILSVRLFAQTFLPASFWPASTWGLILFGAVVSGVIACAAFYPGPRRYLRVMFLLAAISIQLAVCVRMNGGRDQLLGLPNGPRYFYDARVLIAWLLMVVLLTPKLPRWLRFSVGAGLTGWMTVAVLTFGVAPLPDLEWEQHAAAVREGRPAEIPVNPVPYLYHYPGRK